MARPRKRKIKPVDQTKDKIRAFLSRHIRSYELQEDDNFFALGFVNSLFAMQLVMFVEKEFCVAVQDEDLELENFQSINAIAALVERKQAAALK